MGDDIYDMCHFVPTRKSGYEDIPEYKGPVEVANVPQKGIGIVATRDVPAEELLIVSKAFVHGPRETSHEVLAKAIEKRFKRDPRTVSVVYELYATKKSGLDSKSLQKGPKMNMRRVKKVLKRNCFQGRNSIGLWILPSYINNDCIDFNCSWFCIDELLFIRATRSIKQGEELLIHFMDPTLTYKQRKPFFDRFHFICQCRLCLHQLENREDEERKNKILKIVEGWSLKTCPNAIKRDVTKLKEFIAEFEVIGRDGGKPGWNFSIRFLVKKLLEFYEKLGDKTGERETAEKYYKIVNECRREDGEKDRIVMISAAASRVVKICVKCEDWEGAQEWVQILKKDLRFDFGESDVFKLWYPELHSVLMSHGIQC